jgi:hypothetical protein
MTKYKISLYFRDGKYLTLDSHDEKSVQRFIDIFNGTYKRLVVTYPNGRSFGINFENLNYYEVIKLDEQGT